MRIITQACRKPNRLPRSNRHLIGGDDPIRCDRVLAQPGRAAWVLRPRPVERVGSVEAKDDSVARLSYNKRWFEQRATAIAVIAVYGHSPHIDDEQVNGGCGVGEDNIGGAVRLRTGCLRCR